MSSSACKHTRINSVKGAWKTDRTHQDPLSSSIRHSNLFGQLVIIFSIALLVLLQSCLSSHVSHRIGGPQYRLGESPDYIEENIVEEDSPGPIAKSVPLIRQEQSNISSVILHHGGMTQLRREWDFEHLNLANAHLFKIRTKYSCSVPRARLVKVLDRYPSVSKKYVPRYGI